MSDFTSEFWSWFIIAISGGGIVWLFYLLRGNNKAESEQGVPTGHVWDEDLQELNNPLPRWWLFMFYITIFFAIGYLILYPGMGSFKGVLGWTEVGEYEQEVADADAEFGPLFAKFEQTPIAELASDEAAMNAGERLFVNYCAVCHGSDARGAAGFPAEAPAPGERLHACLSRGPHLEAPLLVLRERSAGGTGQRSRPVRLRQQPELPHHEDALVDHVA